MSPRHRGCDQQDSWLGRFDLEAECDPHSPICAVDLGSPASLGAGVQAPNVAGGGRSRRRVPAGLAAVGLLECVPQGFHRGREMSEFVEVLGGEPREPLGAFARERESDDAVVIGVGAPRDQSCRLGSINELDRAVVAQQKLVRDIPDRGAVGAAVPADREQQLVLGGRQPGVLGLLLAPVQEASQTGAQLEQVGVVRVGWQECHVVIRYQKWN